VRPKLGKAGGRYMAGQVSCCVQKKKMGRVCGLSLARLRPRCVPTQPPFTIPYRKSAQRGFDLWKVTSNSIYTLQFSRCHQISGTPLSDSTDLAPTTITRYHTLESFSTQRYTHIEVEQAKATGQRSRWGRKQ
jgi:hypothetical protein